MGGKGFAALRIGGKRLRERDRGMQSYKPNYGDIFEDDQTAPSRRVQSSSPDPDFVAPEETDDDDEDFEVPPVHDPDEIMPVPVPPAKKAKTAVTAQGPAYKPPMVNERGIPAGFLPARMHIARSPTPEDIRDRRTAMM